MIDSAGAHSRRGLLPVSPVALLATLVVFAGLVIVRIATDGDPSPDAPGSQGVGTHTSTPNLNGMTFTDVTETAGLAEPHNLESLYGDETMTAGVAVADVHRNDTPRDRGWLTVKLDDPTTPANRQGVGSKVVVRAGGKRLVRRISTDGSYESQKPTEVHVGLGKSAGRVRVEVTRPGGRRPQVIDDAAVNIVVTAIRSGP